MSKIGNLKGNYLANAVRLRRKFYGCPGYVALTLPNPATIWENTSANGQSMMTSAFIG